MDGVLIIEYENGRWFDIAELDVGDEWSDSVRRIGACAFRKYDGKAERILLAYKDGKPVGLAYGFVLPNRLLMVELLYVAAEHRGCGIGGKMLAEMERVSGCSCSMLFYNKTLSGFYKGHGYVVGENIEVAIKEM